MLRAHRGSVMWYFNSLHFIQFISIHSFVRWFIHSFTHSFNVFNQSFFHFIPSHPISFLSFMHSARQPVSQSLCPRVHSWQLIQFVWLHFIASHFLWIHWVSFQLIPVHFCSFNYSIHPSILSFIGSIHPSIRSLHSRISISLSFTPRSIPSFIHAFVRSWI